MEISNENTYAYANRMSAIKGTISWKEYITNLDVLARCSSIEKVIIKARLRWIGHVKRMEDHRLSKQIMYSELAKGGIDPKIGPMKTPGAKKKALLDVKNLIHLKNTAHEFNFDSEKPKKLRIAKNAENCLKIESSVKVNVKSPCDEIPNHVFTSCRCLHEDDEYYDEVIPKELRLTPGDMEALAMNWTNEFKCPVSCSSPIPYNPYNPMIETDIFEYFVEPCLGDLDDGYESLVPVLSDISLEG